MYFMHKIIVSLANHDIPKKLVPNCEMWVGRKTSMRARTGDIEIVLR
jgi:hypothetical protein